MVKFMRISPHSMSVLVLLLRSINSCQVLLATKAGVPWGISQNWPNIVIKPTNLTGYTLSEWVLVHGIAQCGW